MNQEIVQGNAAQTTRMRGVNSLGTIRQVELVTHFTASDEQTDNHAVRPCGFHA